MAIESIRSLNFDLVFMDMHRMDPKVGFSTPNMMEAAASQAMA